MAGLWYYFIGAGADGNCKKRDWSKKKPQGRGAKGKNAKSAPKPKPAASED